MEGILVVLLLLAGVLTYANLRNAVVYCAVLQDLGVLSSAELRQRRNGLLVQALLVAAVIMALVLATVPLAQLGAISGPVRAAALLLISGLVFSQLFEQWSLRQCERLVAQNNDHLRR